MRMHRYLLPLIVVAGWAVGGSLAWAAPGSVQLELVGNAQGSAMVFQEWVQALGKAGIRNVRIQSNTGDGQPKIDVQGTPDRPLYIVTGIVKSRDELILPGARFRLGEAGRLAQWLDDLAKEGPPDQRERKEAFGLPASRLQKLRGDLAVRVGFSTQDIPRDQVVEKIAERLALRLKLDADATRALSDGVVAEDLAGLSCGTAIAHVLRSVGYGLRPVESNGTITFAVAKIRSDADVWPVGSPSDKSASELAPALYEQHNVNVQNVSAADTLKAVAGLAKMPVLFDHKALARHHIDPTKAMVSLPQTKTTYSIALRKLLFQAKLKFEIRCDEAGTPFFWITTDKQG